MYKVWCDGNLRNQNKKFFIKSCVKVQVFSVQEGPQSTRLYGDLLYKDGSTVAQGSIQAKHRTLPEQNARVITLSSMISTYHMAGRKIIRKKYLCANALYRIGRKYLLYWNRTMDGSRFRR